jgi:hypothetical protein
MTLEEMMTTFPHGSQWHAEGDPDVWTVVGWDVEQYSVLCRRPGSSNPFKTVGWLPQAMSPVVPCPITEPVSLIKSTSGYIGMKGWATDDPGETTITLHPDGRWTWKGGPA